MTLIGVERLYANVRLLSLDVAASALGAGMMAVRVCHVRPHPAFYVLLPAGTWVVYTLDHLLDAQLQGQTARTPRHRFHARHATLLWTVCVVGSVLCAVAGIVAMSHVRVEFAAAVITLFGLHEAMIKLAGNRASPLLMKELGVASIFTAGTWGLPLLLAWRGKQPIQVPILLAVQYALLALVNLIEFSIFEMRLDTRQTQSSFVRAMGRRKSAQIAWGAIIIQATLGLATLSIARPTSRIAIGLLVMMGSVLVGLLVRPTFFMRFERYRTVGDGAFLLPLLMLIRP